MGMYFFAAEHFGALGDALLVTIPNPRWARVLKLIDDVSVDESAAAVAGSHRGTTPIARGV